MLILLTLTRLARETVSKKCSTQGITISDNLPTVAYMSPFLSFKLRVSYYKFSDFSA